MVQNTPTRCGNDLPILLRSDTFLLKSRSVYYSFSEPILVFSIVWQLGWFGMVQNTPTRCRNDLPLLVKNCISDKKRVFQRILART